MAFFNFFKKNMATSDKAKHSNNDTKSPTTKELDMKILTPEELDIIIPSLGYRLDEFLTPEQFFLSDQEKGVYGFVISFEAARSLTGTQDDNKVVEHTGLLVKRNGNHFIFDILIPSTGNPRKIAIHEAFIYQIIENAVNWYPESFSYEEFSKACVIRGSKFIQIETEKEKQNEKKFEFPEEYYLEKYGPANDQEKSLYINARKAYKNFSTSHGSVTAEELLEDLVNLNPNFAYAHFFLGVVRIQNWEARKIHLELFDKWSKKELDEKTDEIFRKSFLNFDQAIDRNPYFEQEILKLQRQGKI